MIKYGTSYMSREGPPEFIGEAADKLIDCLSENVMQGPKTVSSAYAQQTEKGSLIAAYARPGAPEQNHALLAAFITTLARVSTGLMMPESAISVIADIVFEKLALIETYMLIDKMHETTEPVSPDDLARELFGRDVDFAPEEKGDPE